jgi:dipeptidyl aminopeptidase/acylaminoacyl peptidase
LTVAGGEKKKLVSEAGQTDSGALVARWENGSPTTGGPDTSGGVTQTDLYVVPATGGASKQLSLKFDLNVGTPVWSRDGRKIYFSANVLEAVEIFSGDVATGDVRQISHRGSVTGIADFTPDSKSFVGTLSGPGKPAEVYKANAAFTSIDPLTDHNAWLKDYALAQTEVVKWKSKDGMEIEGLLTKPVGYDGGKVPFLLNPHGGPTGSSTNNFNGTVQVLAANGFAVLQPNFRGSTGKSLAFAQANKNTWGKGDYEDCMTGVDAMIASGIADPDRLGAFGWSYGGYMTFWI